MMHNLHMDEFFPKTKSVSNETLFTLNLVQNGFLLKKRTLTMLDQLFVCNIMRPDCPVSHFESKKKNQFTAGHSMSTVGLSCISWK